MRSCLCSIAIGLVAVSVHAAEAETFFLKDGNVIEGTVVRSLGNTVSIKLDRSGLHQLPLSDIDRIEITAEDGGRVVGRLGWWANGAYGLVTETGLIEVSDGVVTSVADSTQTPAPTTETVPGQVEAGQGGVAPAAESLTDEQRSPKLEPTM